MERLARPFFSEKVSHPMFCEYQETRRRLIVPNDFSRADAEPKAAVAKTGCSSATCGIFKRRRELETESHEILISVSGIPVLNHPCLN
jgi:hypothetical protein